jgi:hypothetical protein
VTAWKDLELRICRALGGGRSGPQGRALSDCTDAVPFAVEIKRSSRVGPPVLSKWVIQAKSHSTREGKPWLIVVAGHNDRNPIATLDFDELVSLCREAGRIP